MTEESELSHSEIGDDYNSTKPNRGIRTKLGFKKLNKDIMNDSTQIESLTGSQVNGKKSWNNHLTLSTNETFANHSTTTQEAELSFSLKERRKEIVKNIPKLNLTALPDD